jgi:hypothetical protein
MIENPEVMVEISEKVMVASGLRKTDEVVEEFTDADEAPIEID